MITIPGRSRDTIPAADSPVACKTPENIDLFADVIDLSYARRQAARDKDESRRFKANVRAAKAVCAECPVRVACLNLHGRDYELGVVGGMTDDERRKLFEK